MLMRTRWIRELLSFSRTERNGIIALLLVIFLLILAGLLIPLFFPEEHTDFSKWEAEVNAYYSKAEKEIVHPGRLNLTLFDPNTIDSVALVKMGLPMNLIANWVKYKNKGGRFKDKLAVRRIFGITSQLYEQMDSFIIFPQRKVLAFKAVTEPPVPKSAGKFKRDTIIHSGYVTKGKAGEFVLELNSADSINLLKVPGIGPVLASRIIRYRKLLGGFFAVSQLNEVYGMGRESIPNLRDYLSVNPSKLTAFNINFSTIQELGRHPYIGYRTARKLVRLRDKKGKFLSAEDLSPVVARDSLTRLTPYLKFAQ